MFPFNNIHHYHVKQRYNFFKNKQISYFCFPVQDVEFMQDIIIYLGNNQGNAKHVFVFVCQIKM